MNLSVKSFSPNLQTYTPSIQPQKKFSSTPINNKNTTSPFLNDAKFLPIFTGWSPETQNKKSIANIVNTLKSPRLKTVAISGHNSPDGDSISSTIAMAKLITETTNKSVDVFIAGKMPDRYKFLDNDKKINIIEYPSQHPRTKKYDIAISLDTRPDTVMEKRFKNNIFSKAENTVIIDHHACPLTKECSKSKILIDSSASSASQLVMQFVEPMGTTPEKLGKSFKDAVFVGLDSDTFHLKNVKSPLAYSDNELLVKSGVNKTDISSNTKVAFTHDVIDYKMELIRNTEKFEDGKIAIIYENPQIEKLKTDCINNGHNDTSKMMYKSVLNKNLYGEGREFSVGIKRAPHGYCVSLRSKNADIDKLAEKHGGGGHPKAASYRYPSNMTPEQVKSAIIKDLKPLLTETEENQELK